jgi:hypothetical protein
MNHFKATVTTFIISFLVFAGMVAYVGFAPEEWLPKTNEGAGFCCFILIVSILMMAVCGWCFGGYFFEWFTVRLEKKYGLSIREKCEVIDCPNLAVDKIVIADGSGGRWLCAGCAATPDPRLHLKFANDKQESP